MIIYILCFLVCLSALIFFIAKYKESDLPEEFIWQDEAPAMVKNTQQEDYEQNASGQKNSSNLLEEMKEEATAVQQVQRLFAKADSLPAREIFDLKDKVKDFSYNLEENHLLEEKHYTELKNSIQSIEKRLASFENEYLNNLHPTLTTLIKELETLQNKDKNI